MDTEKCRALLKIIEEGSFSKAAELLGYTSSGLSRLVDSLEEDTGFSLLCRGRHGVLASRECEMLMPLIKDFIRLDDIYRQHCDAILGIDTGTVTVGTAYSLYYRWLSKVIAAFSQKYPGIEVRIKDGKSTELCKMIASHDMDFCIISKREGRMAWHPLFEDPLVAVVSGASDFAEVEHFDLIRLKTEPYIETYPGQDTDNARMFARNDITPNVVFATEDTYASHRMVEAGLGISLSNYIEAREREDEKVRLKKLWPLQMVEIGIATPEDEKLSPAARTFKAFAMEYVDELLEMR